MLSKGKSRVIDKNRSQSIVIWRDSRCRHFKYRDITSRFRVFELGFEHSITYNRVLFVNMVNKQALNGYLLILSKSVLYGLIIKCILHLTGARLDALPFFAQQVEIRYADNIRKTDSGKARELTTKSYT